MKRIIPVMLSLLIILAGCGTTLEEKEPNVVSSEVAVSSGMNNPPTAPVVPPVESSSQSSGGNIDSTSIPPQSTSSSSVPSSSAGGSITPITVPGDEIRAVWISFLEYGWLLRDRTEAQLRSNMRAVCTNLVNSGFNTIYFQVRPYGDAIYPSSYFPWCYLLTGTEGKDPGYDPLDVIISVVREYGLRFEAWINPYRVRNENVINIPMADTNPAKRNLDSGGGDVIRYGNKITYNPASRNTRDLIVNGVLEVIRNYDVDGIHFDDYFYPEQDAAFDSDSYNAYRNSGGSMSLADWRRENVNLLIRQVYAAIKAENPNISFGVSPTGNNENNFNEHYADIATWLSTPGYVDYIAPQIYFGFLNSNRPFASTVREWNDMIKVDGITLVVGIAAYKIGDTDAWAGTGRDEWIDSTDILMRMVLESRNASRYIGFSMYRYDMLFNPVSAKQNQIVAELGNLSSVLR